MALDSFKESLDARSACRIVRRGLLRCDPSLDVTVCPMADGGEGTAAAFLDALDGGTWLKRRVRGPLVGQEVEAGFAWFPDQEAACVEMAQASGLMLVDPEQRNPRFTSTYGTGQLIAAARDMGAKTVWLGVGGSATVDGGMGAAAAFGWKFLDMDGAELDPQGESLARIASVVPPAEMDLPAVVVLSDVENPLLGELGAARVFGPQKGADPATVEFLEQGLGQLACRVSSQLDLEIGEMPRGGAAGGLAAGAVAFLGASLESGIDRVMNEIGFQQLLREMDWVIAGEGSFDRQSLGGKVVAGVARHAHEAGVPLGVIAGRVSLEKKDWTEAGVRWALASAPVDMGLGEALLLAEPLLEAAAETAGGLISA